MKRFVKKPYHLFLFEGFLPRLNTVCRCLRTKGRVLSQSRKRLFVKVIPFPNKRKKAYMIQILTKRKFIRPKDF